MEKGRDTRKQLVAIQIFYLSMDIVPFRRQRTFYTSQETNHQGFMSYSGLFFTLKRYVPGLGIQRRDASGSALFDVV